jgi:carboxylate-amine ligase
VADRLEEMVIKPRTGHGGKGIVVCAHADAGDRARALAEIRARPDEYVAQPMIAISRHPTVVGGRLEPRHVDMRVFVITGAEGEHVVPGGLTRVALAEAALVVNSSQGGGGKDTWVLR